MLFSNFLLLPGIHPLGVKTLLPLLGEPEYFDENSLQLTGGSTFMFGFTLPPTVAKQFCTRFTLPPVRGSKKQKRKHLRLMVGKEYCRQIVLPTVGGKEIKRHGNLPILVGRCTLLAA